MKVNIGEVVRVFDPKTWAANGYDHPAGNDRYFLKAEILAVYDNGKEDLADVRFFHDGRVSHGHFVDAMMLDIP